MEKTYRAFKERQAQRRKIFGYSVSLLSIYILLAGAYFYFNVRWLLDLWTYVGVFSFVAGFIYVMTRSWAQETAETKIFVNMYEASKLLELCSKKDEDSMFYSRKASSKVSSSIRSLGNLCNALNKMLSTLFKREFAEALSQLKESLETRILPRVAQNRDTETMIHVLRGLAQLFGEVVKPITLQDIISKNKDLERFEPIESGKRTTREAFATMISSRPMKFLCSVFLGYFSIIVIAGIFSHFLTIDFVEFLQNNLVGVVSGGAVLSGIVASLLILKK